MEEEEFPKATEELCVHKSWKARVKGYEEAAKLFRTIDDDKSPEWNKYLGLVKKFVVDSNAPAQEKGLDAVLAYVEHCPSAGKTVHEVMGGLVSKCVAAPKAKTKGLASQICLMYIYIEKQEAVIEELLKGTESKNPKISSACVHIITDSLRDYGPNVVKVSKLIKRSITLLEDRDKSVRDETKLLLVEIYHWLGQTLESQLGSLKPAQMTEMLAEFKKVAGARHTPSRFLKSQQPAATSSSNDKDEKGDDEIDDNDGRCEEIDPESLIDPVDILSQIPKQFYVQIESKKWSERKEVLDTLETLLNSAPKLESGDYGDLILALKKVIAKDSNVVVVWIAIKCVGGIAKGLKKKYHPYALVTMQVLFEKFKEKKQNVVAALREATDHVFVSTSIELLLADIIANLYNKNPNIKSEIAGFLVRSLSKSAPSAISNKKTILKPLVDALLKSLVDQDPTVRENAAQALGTAMKLVGEKTMLPLLGDIDKHIMTKITEYHNKAVVLVKSSKRPKSSNEPSSSQNEKTEPSNPKVVRPKGASSSIKKKSTPANSIPTDVALSKAKTLIPPDVLGKLDGTDEAAWSALLKLVQQLDNANEETGEILIAVAKTVPSEDMSTDVLNMKLTIIKLVASNMILSESSILSVIPDILCGMTKKSCSEIANDVLRCFMQLTSIDQVAQFALTNENVLKNPQLWAVALYWVTSTILKTGVIGDAAFLEECGREALGQCDQVRNAGLALIGATHHLGQGSDTKPVKVEKPVMKSSSASKVNEVVKVKTEIPIHDTVSEQDIKATSEPRVDISGHFSEQVMGELVDKNWKVRQEVVNKLLTLIQSSPHITGNLGSSPPCIAARLSDSNTKIAASAITLVESLAKAMGPHGKQHVKVFLPPLLKMIGDPKAWIRTPAISCINTIGEMNGYKEFFENEMMATALKSGSPATRAELWTWLTDKLPNIPPKNIPKDELLACLPVLFNNLEDRNADVRKAANDAVLGFMIHLGYNSMESTRENTVKGSNGATIKLILEKTRGNLPEKPVEKSKSQPSLKKGVAKSATAKMTPGSSATITKSTKVKSASTTRVGASVRKEEEADSGPLLKTNTLKHQRVIDEQKSKVIRWNFATPRPEFVDLLRDQMMTANCNKSLVANMFHSDFKFHLKAIEALNEELIYNVPGLVSNLDLVLKWMTLRFFDTNPSVIIKGLDYLSLAFGSLRNENYLMLDSEASAFVPYLILKGGDPKDNIQSKVKELFDLLKDIYPIGKLFMYVMDGTKSKNSRQRAACLDVLNSYIDAYGVSVCTPSLNAVVKDVVKHFSDRDTAVRNSAMKLAVSMYSHEGERFIHIMNQYTEKDAQLLEDRIRKGARNRPVASVKPMSRETVVIGEASPVFDEDDYSNDEETSPEPPQNPSPPPTFQLTPPRPRNPVMTGTHVFDEQVLDEIESCLPPAVPSPNLADVDLHFLNDGNVPNTIKPLQLPKLIPTLSDFAQPRAITWELTQIASNDIEKAMNAMTQLDTVLSSDKKINLIAFADFMVHQLCLQLIVLNQSHHPEVVNCYRANFAMLTKVCGYQDLCGQITEQTLHKILEQLLALLAESKLEMLDRQDMFRRVVNNIILKILENANKTSVICALIRMLGETMGIPVLPPGTYNDLCVRCLWKLNRAQPKWDHELNYQKLLQEYQKFLKDHPSTWWKSQDVDVPLRTVKTMLHTMVKIRGAEVRNCITSDPSIPDDSELSVYVRKLVKHLKVEDSKESSKISSEVEETRSERSMYSMSWLSKELSDELSDIIRMIGDSDETSEGLKRLYSFMKSYPEADIRPFLAKGSAVFQNYIRKGLAELEMQNVPHHQLSKISGNYLEDLETLFVSQHEWNKIRGNYCEDLETVPHHQSSKISGSYQEDLEMLTVPYHQSSKISGNYLEDLETLFVPHHQWSSISDNYREDLETVPYHQSSKISGSYQEDLETLIFPYRQSSSISGNDREDLEMLMVPYYQSSKINRNYREDLELLAVPHHELSKISGNYWPAFIR